MSEKSEDGTEIFPMDIAQKDVALLGRGGQLRNFGVFYAAKHKSKLISESTKKPSELF